MADKAKDILNLPYSRLLVPDETGGYTAQVVEFPGCFSEGDTAEEAVRNLENAAHAWVEAALAQDLRIPPPTGGIEYKRRYRISMDKQTSLFHTWRKLKTSEKIFIWSSIIIGTLMVMTGLSMILRSI